MLACHSSQMPVEENISIEEAFEKCETIDMSQEHLLEVYDQLKDEDLIIIDFTEDYYSFERTRLNKLDFDTAVVIGFLEVGTLATSLYPITKTYNSGHPEGRLIYERCFNEVLDQHPEYINELQERYVGIPDFQKYIEDQGMDYDSFMNAWQESNKKK